MKGYLIKPEKINVSFYSGFFISEQCNIYVFKGTGGCRITSMSLTHVSHYKIVDAKTAVSYSKMEKFFIC